MQVTPSHRGCGGAGRALALVPVLLLVGGAAPRALGRSAGLSLQPACGTPRLRLASQVAVPEVTREIIKEVPKVVLKEVTVEKEKIAEVRPAHPRRRGHFQHPAPSWKCPGNIRGAKLGSGRQAGLSPSALARLTARIPSAGCRCGPSMSG